MITKSRARQMLAGGDLRQNLRAAGLLPHIRSQAAFDLLFTFISDDDRRIAMRAADMLEKISRVHPEFLEGYNDTIIHLAYNARDKEIKWHMLQMLPRLQTSLHEKNRLWRMLESTLLDKNESKLVRVAALQALSEVCSNYPERIDRFMHLAKIVSEETVPSLRARLRNILKSRPYAIGAPLKN